MKKYKMVFGRRKNRRSEQPNPVLVRFTHIISYHFITQTTFKDLQERNKSVHIKLRLESLNLPKLASYLQFLPV